TPTSQHLAKVPARGENGPMTVRHTTPAAPPRLVAPTGITWTVHRERVLLAGWGRAILLQIAHPKVARGVAEHSAFTHERWGRVRRLRRTLDAMLALTFGSPKDADAVAARINGIH